MSRVRRYSRSGPTAQHPRSPTGLSPSAVTRSSGLRLKDAGTARRLPPPPAHSSNPLLASPAGYAASRGWAPPRSLAATEGILSVPRGTEMFQFPRCPLRDRSPSARPCAGRVAPFGDPRIAGCQRLPGAFRRVAASFVGRQRQGIHHAPFMRIPDFVSIRQTSWRRPQTGARQRDVPPDPAPLSARASRAGSCVVLRDVSINDAVRAGDPPRAHSPYTGQDGIARSDEALARPSLAPAAAEPGGFRVAHCQSAGRRLGLPEVLRPRATPFPDLARTLRTASSYRWRGDPGPVRPEGGAAGIRTPDLRRARAALSQLSYGPPHRGPRTPWGGRAWTRTRDL